MTDYTLDVQSVFNLLRHLSQLPVRGYDEEKN